MPHREMPQVALSAELSRKRDQLLELIGMLESCAVAFSAGVDSTVVACAAQKVLGSRAVAVTGRSASLPAGELDEARRLAALIGIRHVVLDTREFENPSYLQNAPDRCYHCKTELYDRMDEWLEQLDVQVVLNGANLDDQGDYRPGLRAAAEHQVRSPLAECGLSKAEVRQLAAHWGLPVWDKPASPCLSSRVAYGEAVTPARLAMVDASERWLKQRGFPVVRVRYHNGDMARIEAPREQLARLLEPELHAELIEHFRSLGFRFITLDLEGFRSGSLNAFVPLDVLRNP